MHPSDLRARPHHTSIYPHRAQHFIHRSQFHTSLPCDLYKTVGANHVRHAPILSSKSTIYPCNSTHRDSFCP